MTFDWAHLVIRTLVLGALLATMPLLAQRAPSPASPTTTTWSLPSSKFVTALCVDQQGNLWTGTEDEGIWYSPVDGGAPIQYMPKDGLGDEHCYALACDTEGRIWAGHQSHGVSVFNGQKWQNYEVIAGLSRPDSLNGPLGERIFDIAVCPTDGDVWMAGSLGLARYQVATGQWQYITRMEGLPSDQIQSIAFDAKGTIYAGTQCDGLAISKAPYAKWQTIQGPDELPLAPSGPGLPTNLINDVLVGRDGTIWVATTTGLAFSKDKGKTFRFVRGADWADKVKGLYLGTQQEAQAKQPQIKAVLDAGQDAWTLLEDYCTCFAEDVEGRIWVAHRQKPFEILDGRTGERLDQGSDKKQMGKALKDQDHYVFAMAAMPDGQMALGRYGEPPEFAPNAKGGKSHQAAAPAPALFPMPAKAPTESETQSLLTHLKTNDRKLAKGDAVYLGDDWATKGDWVGRYGRQYSVLCAADSPLDFLVSTNIGFYVDGLIGLNCTKDDGLRHWVHWPTTENRNSLWAPNLGHRRQAEWDDHGETYSMNLEGPDLWAVVRVPTGMHRIALYFFNKDGHDMANRYRDYLVQYYPCADAAAMLMKEHSPFAPEGDNAFRLKWTARAYEMTMRQPPLLRARVNHFWGGCYKTVSITGPTTILVRVSRNYSLNTILSAVLIDRIAGDDPANVAFDAGTLPWMGRRGYGPPASAALSLSGCFGGLFACREQIERNTTSSNMAAAKRRLYLELCRMAQGLLPPDAVANWRWRIPLLSASDRTAHIEWMKQAWDEMTRSNRFPSN